MACAQLGWPAPEVATRLQAPGAELAFTAPPDQLLCATEVGEWAWQSLALEAAQPAGPAALLPPLPMGPGHPAPGDAASALETLRRLARAEARPRELRLRAEAKARGIACLVDDDALSLGEGRRSIAWPLHQLPTVDAVPWPALGAIPVALVTGSNGKTTSVRLVAAMLHAAGGSPGFNCTDGVFVDGIAVERGDWSGPAGARAVLRDRRVGSAVLETARGGILRRGLAVGRADAALITNISADHFGEYGVHGLDDLARAKLVVARALGAGGTLVLNADDATLVRTAVGIDAPLAWFAIHAGNAVLQAAAERGASTCAGEDGQLVLRRAGVPHLLGPVAAMPLALGGAASYNLANIAGAALLASLLGVDASTIAGVLAHFGAAHGDNPGRLARWSIGGATVLVDYAHNPEGLAGLLAVAQALRGEGGRLLLLLGQAGNRDDEAIAALAAVAAAARPSRVVLKDIAGYLRGRAEGDVARLLSGALQAHGLAAQAISMELDELAASQVLVREARAGDVVVLPVHNLDARDRLAAWLDAQ
jgi:UDP-N-acetylmuramyl tripeptide synthase